MQMTKTPPVPKENRSPHEQDPPPAKNESEPKPKAPENLREQGRQGNIRQNTTNQGYQQDR